VCACGARLDPTLRCECGRAYREVSGDGGLALLTE
jgi:hypothetical protein